MGFKDYLTESSKNVYQIEMSFDGESFKNIDEVKDYINKIYGDDLNGIEYTVMNSKTNSSDCIVNLSGDEKKIYNFLDSLDYIDVKNNLESYLK